jgi:hypothetical protein
VPKKFSFTLDDPINPSKPIELTDANQVSKGIKVVHKGFNGSWETLFKSGSYGSLDDKALFNTRFWANAY